MPQQLHFLVSEIYDRAPTSTASQERSTPNHSTNMVDSPSKKQTCPWDLLHSHARWFIMNLLFYDQNESL